MDKIWNYTEATWYELDILDEPVTLSNSNYSIWIITWTVENLDIINIFWANEWSCGTWDLSVQLSWCSFATWILVNEILSIEPEDDIEENGACEIYVLDN